MISYFAAMYRHFTSRFDPSTKLGNHVKLAEDIARAKHVAASTSGALIVVEILDHELVRRIFLASGAKAIDQLLQDISDRLGHLLSKYSRLYYVGVGRFAILTPRKTEDLDYLILSIKDIMKKPFVSGNFKSTLEIVIGLLPMARARIDPVDALRKATVATYQAREDFSTVARYDLSFDELQIKKHFLLQEIPAAISERQFSLVFQPKIDLNGTVVGAEALLRWTHPKLGPIGPGEFIPLADNTDLMIDITNWVAREALQACAALVRQGLFIHVAFNISSRNLNDSKFAGHLISMLEDLSLSPSSIQLECTEYSALKSPQCLISLNMLSEAGICIALDDFGSGYSNMAALAKLPISLLKIDRSLIDPISESVHSMKFLEGIIKFGKSLGYRIAAEGVETKEVLQLLHFLDLDEMQGYAIGKPMDFASLVKFINAPSVHF